VTSQDKKPISKRPSGSEPRKSRNQRGGRKKNCWHPKAGENRNYVLTSIPVLKIRQRWWGFVQGEKKGSRDGKEVVWVQVHVTRGGVKGNPMKRQTRDGEKVIRGGRTKTNNGVPHTSRRKKERI